MNSLKAIHMFCAYATGLGFLARGLLAIFESPLLGHRVSKTLPHLIDTCLLASGLIMFYSWSVSLTSVPWLIAKIIALLLYIGFGLLMLRWGTTASRRKLGLIGGLAVYTYIVGVAHSKLLLSWLAFL